jgi:large subunit ribosomal protein L3
MLELVGKKIGMTHIHKEIGNIVPLTMVQIYDNCVLDVVALENSEYKNLIIAFKKLENAKKLSKSVAGIFNKKSIPLHKIIRGCKVPKNSEIKIGDTLDFADLIKVGDTVNISGTTIGKGFAGVMKRWNFRGLEASHGVSISHRSHGSTGQRQDPGKTFRGKKMAGHMGVDKVTVRNLEVFIVDKDKSIIAIKGAIPGKSGAQLVVKIKN